MALAKNEIMDHTNHADPAATKISDFLQIITTSGGLNLKPEILACNGQVQPASSDPAREASPVSTSTSSNNIPVEASLPEAETPQSFKVEFTGPDTPLLLARNGELLLALEHVAAKILRLESEEHDRISFDAEGFKANRVRELNLSAEAAIQKVRATSQPYAFPPMTSRERRMLHLALASSGLPSASSGEGSRRFVVLYPEGYQPSAAAASPASSHDRTHAIRKSFRRR
jgi:spoIIIJ-associated protein